MLHYKHTKMTKMKHTENTIYWQDLEEWKFPHNANGNIQEYNCFEKFAIYYKVEQRKEKQS